MSINQAEKDKLFKGLGLFREAFSSYIKILLVQKSGDRWIDDFIETLSPQQRENWTISVRKGAAPEKLIDFHHFKFFIIKNKDLVRGDFGNKTNDLPTWLGEIADVRHKIAHFDELDEDEVTKVWIHLRKIANAIGMTEVEQKIRDLEESKAEESPQPSPIEIKVRQVAKQRFYPVQSNPSETLDIVNCANADFRQTVFSHNVYLCPAQGGAYKHKQCKYLGIYWDKRVGAVAEIEAVIDVHSEDEAFVYFINGNRKTEDYISRAKDKALQLRPNDLPVRVFLLDNLQSTDFIKDSPGGMFGSKIYLNIHDLDVNNAEDLGEKLDGKTYSEFGL